MTPGGQCYDGLQTGPGACMWFNNYTFITGQPTLPDHMRTYQDVYYGAYPFDWTKSNPWRHPGSAPIFSPCGVAGGNPWGCPIGSDNDGVCPGGGFAHGSHAEYVQFQDVVETEWRAGGVAEVGWGIIANHGGGYSYRLCKRSQSGVVTEECFQQTPLKFHGNTQWIQYGDDGPKVTFQAHRTTQGTWPVGSEWTRNPIPACHSTDGGFTSDGQYCTRTGPQFTPPGEGLLGFGHSAYDPSTMHFYFTIMDEVEVPDVTPGQYVLSFRWDCEQTSQVWAGCANVNIV